MSMVVDCTSLTQGITAALILFKHTKAASQNFDSIEMMK